jgi:ATP-dependent Clp protease ATP-binding subunit ClpB
VFNILLQILDDVRLTDSQGRVVDFKNTIIIMTSNLGSSYLLNNDSFEMVEQLLKQTFRPEFLNRIDEIVTFNPLDKNTQIKIVDKLLSLLQNRLKEQYYQVKFTDNLKQFIIDKSFTFEYGARPIKRFIQREVETTIAKAIISGKLNSNSIFTVDVVNDEIKVY